MIERSHPLDPSVTVRADGTVWCAGQQLVGSLNSLGYLCLIIAGREIPYATVIRDAFSPTRHRQRDVSPEERREILEESKADTIRAIAARRKIAYHVVWRIVNGRV